MKYTVTTEDVGSLIGILPTDANMKVVVLTDEGLTTISSNLIEYGEGIGEAHVHTNMYGIDQIWIVPFNDIREIRVSY